MKQQKTVPDPAEAQAEITRLLKRTGLTVSELARETKTASTTLWEWAKTDVEPTYSAWKRFVLAASRLPTKNGKKR